MIRVLTTILVLLLLGIGGLAAYQYLHDPGQQDTAQPDQPVPSNDLGSPLPSPSDSPTGDPDQIAQAFATSFTNVQGGKDAWLRRLRPVVSDEMARGFGMTDPRQIPTGTVKQLDPVQVGDRTASTRVVYDSGLVLQLTLAPNQANRWVVTRNAPVKTP